jgi:hypothetical protein
LGEGGDIVDAEDVGAAEEAGDGAGQGAGIAVEGIGLLEDVADDGFPGDGEEDGAFELVEAIEVAEDGEVVMALLGEVDTGVEDEVIGGEAGGLGEGDFFFEEVDEGGPEIVPGLGGVRFLGEADAVHDEEGGVVFGAEFGVYGIWQGAHVVDEFGAVLEGGFDDFGAPGIDGEEGGPEAGVVAGRGRVEGVDEGGPGVEKGAEAVEFRGGGDGVAVGAGAFGADVDDVGAVAEHLRGLIDGFVRVEGAVAGKGIVVDIDDAHDEGAAGEGDAAGGGAEDHGEVMESWKGGRVEG